MSWAPGPGPLPTAQPVPWPAPATPAGTGVIQHAACPSSSRDGADGGAEILDAKTFLRYAPGRGEPCPGDEAAQAPRGHVFVQSGKAWPVRRTVPGRGASGGCGPGPNGAP